MCNKKLNFIKLLGPMGYDSFGNDLGLIWNEVIRFTLFLSLTMYSSTLQVKPVIDLIQVHGSREPVYIFSRGAWELAFH